jgi:hypothetical protein
VAYHKSICLEALNKLSCFPIQDQDKMCQETANKLSEIEEFSSFIPLFYLMQLVPQNLV